MFWDPIKNRVSSRSALLEAVYLKALLYFKSIEFFCHFYIFQKIWQCLALCSCQGYRLIIAGCIKKWLCSKKIQTPWTIRLVSDTCSQKNRIVQGVWIFSWILHNHRFFFEHSHFLYIQQWLASSLYKSTKLNIAKFFDK